MILSFIRKIIYNLKGSLRYFWCNKLMGEACIQAVAAANRWLLYLLSSWQNQKHKAICGLMLLADRLITRILLQIFINVNF
jgi:hypothetical protein